MERMVRIQVAEVQNSLKTPRSKSSSPTNSFTNLISFLLRLTSKRKVRMKKKTKKMNLNPTMRRSPQKPKMLFSKSKKSLKKLYLLRMSPKRRKERCEHFCFTTNFTISLKNSEIMGSI